jgi:hypothetical protein
LPSNQQSVDGEDRAAPAAARRAPRAVAAADVIWFTANLAASQSIQRTAGFVGATPDRLNQPR